MSRPVLALRGVSKSYNPGKANEIRVLSDINLEISSGEVVGLVAPSGAGKSTMLFIAGLLEPADAGEVIINGLDASRANDAEQTRLRRQTIGIVYQFHHLLPEFTALENVMLPQLADGMSHSRSLDRATLLLNEAGLGDRIHHRPAAMSGGEQQRVAVCRSLANSPALVLADEPTGNLDSETARSVFALMSDHLHESGCAALVATHNTELAARMDRIVNLHNGTLTTGN